MEGPLVIDVTGRHSDVGEVLAVLKLDHKHFHCEATLLWVAPATLASCRPPALLPPALCSGPMARASYRLKADFRRSVEGVWHVR